MKKGMVLLSASVLLCMKLHAQNQLQQFIKRINTLDRPIVSYDYKVQLYNVHTGKVEDSINGRIYKKEHEYLDSSGSAIVTVNGKYFCKLDHQRKEAVIYNLDLIQRKLNLKIDKHTPDAMIIPDSVILKYGSLTADTTRSHHIYRWTSRTGSATGFTAVIERGSLKLTRLTVEATESSEESEPLYKKICTIYNIRNEFPGTAISLSRFCDVNGNKVTLNTKYAGYNLKTLIN